MYNRTHVDVLMISTAHKKVDAVWNPLYAAIILLISRTNPINILRVFTAFKRMFVIVISLKQKISRMDA